MKEKLIRSAESVAVRDSSNHALTSLDAVSIDSGTLAANQDPSGNQPGVQMEDLAQSSEHFTPTAESSFKAETSLDNIHVELGRDGHASREAHEFENDLDFEHEFATATTSYLPDDATNIATDFSETHGKPNKKQRPNSFVNETYHV